MNFISNKLILLVFANTAFTIQASNSDARSLYIELLKKCIIGLIYQDPGLYNTQFDLEKRENGRDWPTYAHTMIGLKRLSNIQSCLESIIENNIEGDLIETGVWRGGAVIFMRGILKAYNITDRNVWVADSFEGLPKPNETAYPADSGDHHHQITFLNVSLETVKNNFARYGLLDDQVRFLKGWFKNTLPKAPISKLALLRLDGDMYESTMDGLINLYPKLSIGGYIIIDDYALKPCAVAVNDYRRANNITDEMIQIDNDGVYWKKTK